jgi:hypothetical protein
VVGQHVVERRHHVLLNVELLRRLHYVEPRVLLRFRKGDSVPRRSR